MTGGKNVYRVPAEGPGVRVVIAATGSQGERAREALVGLDASVASVETAAEARERVADAEVVVLGELESGSPAAVREAIDGAGTVGLGVEGTVTLPADPGPERLRDAVQEVRQAREYRRAVDDLYERCREYARDGDGAAEESVEEALERADEAFEALDDAETVSYSDLLDRE